MDEEWFDRESWITFSVACRKNITHELIESFNEADRQLVMMANRDNRIFTAPIGGEQIPWILMRGVLVPSSSPEFGWRERCDGIREIVYLYDDGWMTADEIFDSRQKYPRTAP